MKRVFSIMLLGLLPAWAGATEPDAASKPAPSEVVEIFRYEAAPRGELDDAVRNRLSSELGELARRVMLKAGDVEHHEDYVATILLVAGNPMTRLQVSRIVTRPIKRGRRRDRASTVVLPDRDGRVVSSEGVRSILAGRGGRSRPDRGQPPW